MCGKIINNCECISRYSENLIYLSCDCGYHYNCLLRSVILGLLNLANGFPNNLDHRIHKDVTNTGNLRFSIKGQIIKLIHNKFNSNSVEPSESSLEIKTKNKNTSRDRPV